LVQKCHSVISLNVLDFQPKDFGSEREGEKQDDKELKVVENGQKRSKIIKKDVWNERAKL
jgi:hypothetical protein